MQRETRNFDDPVGISSEHEIIVTENECSGATPVDVSALEEPKRDPDRASLKTIETANEGISSYIYVYIYVHPAP